MSFGGFVSMSLDSPEGRRFPTELSEQLLALDREKKMRQAEIILDALSKSGNSLSAPITFLGGREPKKVPESNDRREVEVCSY